MTTFIRLVHQHGDKATSLQKLLKENQGASVFEVDPGVFSMVPGAPFAYWCGAQTLRLFKRIPAFGEQVTATVGMQSSDDFRFLRLWFEGADTGWSVFAKGGSFCRGYSDLHLLVNWRDGGLEVKAFAEKTPGSNHWSRNIRSTEHYFRPGLTWTPRTQSGLGMRALPSRCIFANKGPAAFVDGDRPTDLLALLALTTSSPFCYLAELQVAFGSYEVGVIQRTPVPRLSEGDRARLARLALRQWTLKWMLDSVWETSHAFLLPRILRGRIEAFDPGPIKAELDQIAREIDEMSFEIYGITGHDKHQIEFWARESQGSPLLEESHAVALPQQDGHEGGDERPAEDEDGLDLISWTVGVSFGRFDIRLATCERQAPSRADPFDPLATSSPGMLPEADSPFRRGAGILVDDPGHRDDISAVVGSVMTTVKVDPLADLRRTLARDFFPFHIRRYSKSRRKAPIYWQLATPSASYSVWLYLHAFSADTMYKVQNDYVAPKLKHEEQKLDSLRREHGDDPAASQRKEQAAQEAFVEELRTLLDEVKRVAPLWKPDLDDGVIINFAPLWRLVPHHRSWQKDCKATWDALCDGEYDWSHLAMHVWPERVVPKCQKDRSLAIAHGMEDTFWVEDSDGKWTALAKPRRPLADLVKERISPAVKAALVNLMSFPPSGTRMQKPPTGARRNPGRRKP